MNKQAEIRDGLIKFIKRGRQHDTPEDQAETLLRYLHSQGVMIELRASLPYEILCKDGTIAWVAPLIVPK